MLTALSVLIQSCVKFNLTIVWTLLKLASHFIGSQVMCRMNNFRREDLSVSIKGHLAWDIHCSSNQVQNLIDLPTLCLGLYQLWLWVGKYNWQLTRCEFGGIDHWLKFWPLRLQIDLHWVQYVTPSLGVVSSIKCTFEDSYVVSIATYGFTGTSFVAVYMHLGVYQYLSAWLYCDCHIISVYSRISLLEGNQECRGLYSPAWIEKQKKKRSSQKSVLNF